MKKLLTLLVALLATTAIWAYDFHVNGIYYNYNTDTSPYSLEVTFGENAYQGDIVIPDTVPLFGGRRLFAVTRIGKDAFENDTALLSVTLPNTITTIRDWSFFGSSIQTIHLGNGVDSIGGYVFLSCPQLSQVTGGENVEFIGRQAFEGTSWLENLPNGVVYIGKTLYNYKGEMPANTSINVKDGTLSITEEAFVFQDNLASITIPKSVKKISGAIVRSCDALTKIIVDVENPYYDSRENCNAIIETETNKLIAACNTTKIPESIVSIGTYAFNGCNQITSITLPDNLTTIENSAFSFSRNLASITIGKNITSVGYSAFNDTPWYNNQPEGLVYLDYILLGYKGGDLNYEDVVVKDGISTIAQYVFFGPINRVINISSLTIGKDVKYIHPDAFSNNNVSSIQSVIWNAVECNDFLTSTSVFPYYLRKNITSFTFGEEVKHIPAMLCSYMSSLKLITLPNTVKTIGRSAFNGCYEIESINIPNGVKVIETSTFAGCSKLKSITIPNSVQIINTWAFESCSSLENLVIGENVKTIGAYAFSICKALKTVISYATNPPTLDYGVFSNVPTDKVTLYVPGQSIELYKSADQWKDFYAILPLSDAPASVGNIEYPFSTSNSQKYFHNGQLIIIRDGIEYNAMGQEL